MAAVSDIRLFNPVHNMERTPVRSSYLDSVGWEDGVMEVEFQDGAIYEYDVPYISDFWDLLDTDSKGQWFYYNIRDSVPFRKVKGRTK